MRNVSFISFVISSAVLASACATSDPDAADPGQDEPDQPTAEAAITNPPPDHVVTCNCNGSNSCPVLASLSVNGGKSIPAYCNVNTPGTQGTYGVLYQCMEYSNRFLVE